MSTYNLIQDGESGLLVRTTLNELLTAANTGFTGVYYQINANTFPTDSKSGDVLLITQDGTSGSSVTQEWIYNGSGWTPISTSSTEVYYRLSGDTFPTGSTTGDFTFITNDGTSGGTVTQQYIYDGLQWKDFTITGGTGSSCITLPIYQQFGNQSSFLLSYAPLGAITVFNNGVQLPSSGYTLSGNSVTIDPSITNLDIRVLYFYTVCDVPSGTSGTSGTNGSSGTNGTSGSSGSSGTSGVSGTSGLNGDKYRTSGTGTYTLGVVSGGTLTITQNYGYSVAQSILVVYDKDNYQTSSVVSYNDSTGVLVFTGATSVVGSGTYTNWTINLAGAAGGDGSSGTSGASGETGTSGTSGTNGTSGTSATGSTLTYTFTGGTTWTITHNLGSLTPLVQAYKSDGNQIIPQTITVVDSNTVTITFSTNTAGRAVVSSGLSGGSGTSGTSGQGTSGASGTSGTSGINGTSGTSGTGSTLTYTFTGGTTWTITHNLGTATPLVQAYESNGNQLIPSSITVLTNDSVQITFAQNTAGRAVVSSGLSGTSGAAGTSGSNGTSGTSGTSGAGIPTGGTDNQLLVKSGSTNYITSWITPSVSNGLKMLSGGTSGQTLTKIDNTDYNVKWESPTNLYVHTYSNASYALPSGYTADPCRYNVIADSQGGANAWFNTSTYSFTPQKAGYWLIIAGYDVYRGGAAESTIEMRKNNNSLSASGGVGAVYLQTQAYVYVNGTTDYISVVNVGSGDGLSVRGQGINKSNFQARWICD